MPYCVGNVLEYGLHSTIAVGVAAGQLMCATAHGVSCSPRQHLQEPLQDIHHLHWQPLQQQATATTAEAATSTAQPMIVPLNNE